ncbi:hypothetical protein JI741_31170 [Chryseolinea sp. Jin1]|uniref:DUF6671 domain-containing protein n=2 Tax=Chryseolinea lacunae TaxID=2801331 RepID=A0ABS1L218_9BACT|nr:DUF6671 family protein [Chryseolinea lacunae]MBL0745736.1 hypothetical protein [Chryseolinea lacunae]
MLIDTLHGFEIIDSEISPHTNFHLVIFDDWRSAENFALRIGVPEHGLILKSSQGEIIKEIQDVDSSRKILDAMPDYERPLTMETDMRAMRNPTHMKIIGMATENLLASIFCLCPVCATPGFKIVNSINCLPCLQCGTPTRLVRRHVYECSTCLYTEQRKLNMNEGYGDPQYCDDCNP